MLVKTVQYNLFIWLFSFGVFLPCLNILIFWLPLSGLNSKSTSLSSRFYGCRTRQYITICGDLNLISEFFAFFWLIFWGCGINKCWLLSCIMQGMFTQGPTPYPRYKYFIIPTVTLLLDSQLYQECHVHGIVDTNDWVREFGGLV